MAEEGKETPGVGYATLGQAMFGHVILSVFSGPPLVGVLWLLGWLMGPEPSS